MACLVFAVALAGCDSTLDVRVWQYEHATFAEIYDADCECEELAPPFIGQCVEISDVGRDECVCHAPSSCIAKARIERDGVSLVTTPIAAAGGAYLTADFRGDFAGASLVLEGCDEDVRVELAGEYPPTPTASARSDSSGSTQISWNAEPSIDYVRVRAGVLFGTLCVVEPTQASTTLLGVGDASVTFIRERPVPSTSLGQLHAYTAASADVSTQSSQR